MRNSHFFVLFIFFFSCTGKKQPESYLTVQPLPFHTDNSAGEPNLAKSDAGDIFMSWIEEAGDESFLMYSRLENNAWGPSEMIASGKNWFINWADFPSLLTLKKGMVAHYLAYMDDNKYAYGIRLTSKTNSENWSSPIMPHDDNTPTEHGFVSMVPLNEDQYMVIWLDGRKYAASDSLQSKEMTLRSALFDLAGSKISEQVIDERTCDCCQTDAAITSKGPVVVYRDRSDFEIRDIYLSRFENNSWTEPHSIHPDNWKIPGCPVNGPAIDAAGNEMAVAWFTAANSIPEVKLAFSHNDGDTFDPPTKVDLGHPLGRVDVVLYDQFAIVSWLEEKDKTAFFYARKIYENGAMEKPFLITKMENSRGTGFPRVKAIGKELIFTLTQPGEPSQIHTYRGILK